MEIAPGTRVQLIERSPGSGTGYLGFPPGLTGTVVKALEWNSYDGDGLCVDFDAPHAHRGHIRSCAVALLDGSPVDAAISEKDIEFEKAFAFRDAEC